MLVVTIVLANIGTPLFGISLYFETRSACYRGPKPQKRPKWLGEDAKSVLVHENENPVAFGAREGCTGARHSRETISPAGQSTFCTLS